MSVAVMSDVWAGYPGGGSELLTLLALADYGNDDGLSIHPSIEALARKVRISESRVRRILRELEAQNLLMVVGNHAGGTPGTTRQYRLNVRKIRAMGDKARDEMQAAKRTKKKTCDIPDFADFDNLTPCASATPCVDATPCVGAHDPLRQRTPPLAPAHMTPCVDASLTTIEPSIEPPTNHHIPPVAVAPVAGPVFPPIDDIVVKQAKPAPVGTVAVVEAAEVVEHTPTAKPKATKPAGDKTAVAAVACPSDVDAAVFADFLAIRKVKRAPLTATALGGIRREADKAGVTLEEALTVCCERGWVGFRADWHHEGAVTNVRAGGTLNKQEALEARNRAVAAQWVADMQAKMNAQGGVL